MGMPVNGIGYTGYDNMNKKYTMLWIDNSSTAMFLADGNFDQTGNVLTMYGKMDEPTTDEYGKNVRYVIRIIDHNKFVFEIHESLLQEGKTKSAEMVCS